MSTEGTRHFSGLHVIAKPRGLEQKHRSLFTILLKGIDFECHNDCDTRAHARTQHGRVPEEAKIGRSSTPLQIESI